MALDKHTEAALRQCSRLLDQIWMPKEHMSDIDRQIAIAALQTGGAVATLNGEAWINIAAHALLAAGHCRAEAVRIEREANPMIVVPG